MKLCFFLLALFCSDLVLAQNKHILILHSYDMSYAWTQKLQLGLSSELDNLRGEFKIHVEFLDARKHRSQANFSRVAQGITEKYAQLPIQYVITTDDDAFKFYLDHYQKLFAGSELFFAGKGGLDQSQLGLHTGKIYGVMEYMPLVENMRLGQRLHKTNVAYFISDASTTGKAQAHLWKNEFARRLPDMDIRFISLEDYTHQEMLTKVAQLKEGFILLNVIGEDKAGEVVDNLFNTTRLTQAAHIPVYAESSIRMGHGVIGGIVKDGEIHGQAIARKLIDIYRGKSVRAIDPAGETLTIFDYSVMKKFGIKVSDLPANARVLNMPAEQSQLMISVLLGLIGVLLLVMLVQFYRNRARKLFNLRLEKLVEERTQELNQQVLEQKRLRKAMVLKEKLASLGLLTAGIAHELKNPLNIILNSAMVIDKRLQQHGNEAGLVEVSKMNQFVIKSTKRADSIISNMLGQVRTLPGEQSAQCVNQLIREASGLVYHACKNRYESADFVILDLQATSTLYVASETIIRMMINLLENSYYSLEQKFKMLGDSFNAKLAVKTYESKDDFFIEVYDNGMGIEQEVIDRVWLPFFTTKDVGDGTGLGLAMVHDIVSSYNGDVSIDSLIGEHTCFKIRLPKASQTVH